MADHQVTDEILEFPCDHEFKAFGPNHDDFSAAVLEAINAVMPVSRHAMRERKSSGGKYRCVTILLRVHSRGQLTDVYRQIRQVEGLRYLL